VRLKILNEHEVVAGRRQDSAGSYSTKLALHGTNVGMWHGACGMGLAQLSQAKVKVKAMHMAQERERERAREREIRRAVRPMYARTLSWERAKWVIGEAR